MKTSKVFELFRRKELKEIFTPNTVAKLAYVRRGDIEASLLSNIAIPGKQIILFYEFLCFIHCNTKIAPNRTIPMISVNAPG